MLIRLLPLLAALLPFAAINIAYGLGVAHGVLPECIPYIEGCTSISSTGRHPPGSFLFRAVQMPLAVLLMLIWYYSVAWLRSLDTAMQKGRGWWILTCGCTAGIALLVYVTFLGSHGAVYEFMRRFGIYGYFLGTVLSQFLVSLQLLRCSGNNTALLKRARIMLLLSLLPVAMGVLNLILKVLLSDANSAENRIEWLAATAMQTWLLLLYFAWRRTGFTASVTTDRTSAH